MSRRTVVGVALVAAAILAGFISCRSAPAPSVRPNLILVTVDTLRADHLPFMGYPRNTAPFLTALAQQGVVFEHAHSTSGWTIPAVASLFTSLYPQQHGLVLGLKRIPHAHGKDQRVGRLPETVRTLPEVLQQAGYATFGVVDNSIVSVRRNFDRGFRRFTFTRNGGAEAVTHRVLAWKALIHARRPYFLYLHYNDPHHPYLRRAPWFKQYVADGKVEDLPGQEVAAYDSEIRWLDDHIRALHDALGWARDTVVVMTADHGEGFDDHGSQGHSYGLYGELLNVPLVVWDGGHRFGPRRVGGRVSLIDVLPTLRGIAGLPPDPIAEGRNLVPLLVDGTGGDPQRTLLAHIRPWGGPEIRAVVEGRWKLILNPNGRRQLFDLAADPHEKVNRLAAEPATADRLTANYDRFERAARRYESVEVTAPLDPETEEDLEALGYVR